MYITSTTEIQPVSMHRLPDGTNVYFLRKDIKQVEVTTKLIEDLPEVTKIWTAAERRIQGTYTIVEVLENFDTFWSQAPADAEEKSEEEYSRLYQAIIDIQELTAGLLADLGEDE